MKVIWHPNDIRRGRRVWRDMECVLCSEDYNGETATRFALVVVATSRIMFYGPDTLMAAYMNEWEYRPVAEK